MHDVTYRGQVGCRILFSAKNNVGIVVSVLKNGRMDLLAAFPLSVAQLLHILSQAGRLN